MKKQDKGKIDLHRLLESQNFKSQEEVRKFMDDLIAKPIPSFPKDSLTIKEQAQDLIYEAIEQSEDKGYQLALEALQLDPDCTEAYEYLGAFEPIPETSILYFKNGVDIGRRIFANNYLKANIGNFWLIHETRPFMRCLRAYADCLSDLGRFRDSVEIFEEMIKLNPNDNQGVRDQLLIYSIKINDFNKFRKYDKMYKDDHGACMSFNRALFAFKTEGSSSNSNGLLNRAIRANKHIIPKLISKSPQLEIPEVYGVGDIEEAKYYTFFARKIWQETDHAIEWIKRQTKGPGLKIVK